MLLKDGFTRTVRDEGFHLGYRVSLVRRFSGEWEALVAGNSRGVAKTRDGAKRIAFRSIDVHVYTENLDNAGDPKP